MATPPASFNSLPNEIHTLIIIQVSLQDEVYRAEKTKHSALKSLDEPYEVIRSKKLKIYGHSLMALYSTCTILRSLCLPFVFKVLRLSKTVSPIFQELIEPFYLDYFETLLLDRLDDVLDLRDEEDEWSCDSVWCKARNWEGYDRRQMKEEEAIEDLLFNVLPEMLSLSKIEVPPTYNSADCVLGRIHEIAAEARSSHSKRGRAMAKQVTQALSSIFTIDFQSRICNFPLPATFKHLAEVSVFGESGESLENYKIPSLKHLTSLSVRIRPQKRRDSGSIPPSWMQCQWMAQDSLESLELDLPTITDADKRFILKFSDSLSSLTLRFDEWTAETSSKKMSFPCLDTLVLEGKKQDLTVVLNQLSRSSTPRTLKLVLSSSSTATQDFQSLFRALKSFYSPKTNLKIQLYEQIRPASESQFTDFINSTVFASASLTSLTPWKSWAENASTSKGSKAELLKAKWQGMALRSFLADLEQKVKQAERVGDTSALAEWGRWLEPAMGRSTLDLQ